jgi:hypothetical protein
LHQKRNEDCGRKWIYSNSKLAISGKMNASELLNGIAFSEEAKAH